MLGLSKSTMKTAGIALAVIALFHAGLKTGPGQKYDATLDRVLG